MMRKETAKVLALLQAMNPQRAGNSTQEDALLTINVWHLAIGDLPYDVTEAVVHDWIRSEKWMPFPAEIRERVICRALGWPRLSDAFAMAVDYARSMGDEKVRAITPLPVREALALIGGVRAINYQSQDTQRLSEAFGKAYADRIRAAVLTANPVQALGASNVSRGTLSIEGGEHE